MKRPSIVSKIIEKLLWFTKSTTLKGVNDFDEHFEKLSHQKPKAYELPIKMFKSKVTSYALNNMPIYHFSPTGKGKKCMIYFHGGGFIHEIKIVHWILIDRICQKTSMDILVPIYPLAPQHSFIDSNETLMSLYDKVLERFSEEQIVFMSDSAGSSLAISMTLQLLEKNLSGPSQNILVSPWVDLSMKNDDVYKAYEDLDPILGLYALRKAGKAWAGDLSVEDPLISPINGDLSKLKNCLIITGTKDLLYPDIKRFYQMLNKNNQYLEYEDMLHAFLLFGLPESIEAEKVIIDYLLNKDQLEP